MCKTEDYWKNVSGQHRLIDKYENRWWERGPGLEQEEKRVDFKSLHVFQKLFLQKEEKSSTTWKSFSDFWFDVCVRVKNTM